MKTPDEPSTVSLVAPEQVAWGLVLMLNGFGFTPDYSAKLLAFAAGACLSSVDQEDFASEVASLGQSISRGRRETLEMVSTSRGSGLRWPH